MWAGYGTNGYSIGHILIESALHSLTLVHLKTGHFGENYFSLLRYRFLLSELMQINYEVFWYFILLMGDIKEPWAPNIFRVLTT